MFIDIISDKTSDMTNRDWFIDIFPVAVCFTGMITDTTKRSRDRNGLFNEFERLSEFLLSRECDEPMSVQSSRTGYPAGGCSFVFRYSKDVWNRLWEWLVNRFMRRKPFIELRTHGDRAVQDAISATITFFKVDKTRIFF